MASPPKDIRALRSEGVLQVTWPDGRVVRFPFKFLRCACTCASCVHEFTGEQLLDPDSVPADITVVDMALVGAYGVRIRWSDQHETGIFTWRALSELTPPEGDD